jgi:hypothetical protein
MRTRIGISGTEGKEGVKVQFGEFCSVRVVVIILWELEITFETHSGSQLIADVRGGLSLVAC